MTEHKLYAYDATGLFFLSAVPESAGWVVEKDMRPVLPIVTARFTSKSVAPDYLVYVGTLALHAEGFEKSRTTL
jgi:hypothetical protein